MVCVVIGSSGLGLVSQVAAPISIRTFRLALALFTIWLVARTITQPLGSVIPQQPPTLMHLLNGYLIPFAIYAVLRMTPLDLKKIQPGLLVCATLTMYLCVTAFFEKAQIWSLVWPAFIGDPELGIHFGRARGPMLQSVRLGMCLIMAWSAIAIFTIWCKPTCRLRWTIFIVSTGLIWPAIFFTSTRSIWLGLAFVLGLLVLMATQGIVKRAALFTGGCAAIVGLALGPNLLEFKREYSAAETKESAYMRTAFAYVSVKMFKDKPIAGFGFNQFQIYNLPYLSDRSTKIRLESIRGYVHHNGFLSILVDLGVVGFALYMHFILTVIFQSLALWKASQVPRWVRGFALLTLCFVGAHAIQMAFHELSFSSIENTLLLAVCGLMVASSQQYCVRESVGDSLSLRPSQRPRFIESAKA